MTAQRSISGLWTWFLLHWTLLINSKTEHISSGILDRWALVDGWYCYGGPTFCYLLGVHLWFKWLPRGQFLDFGHDFCCIGLSLSIVRQSTSVLDFWTGEHWLTADIATGVPTFRCLPGWVFTYGLNDCPEVNFWTLDMIFVALDSPYQ